jgi:hypothetical protein
MMKKTILAAALVAVAVPAVAQEESHILACKMMIASMDKSIQTKKTVVQEKPTLKVQYENIGGAMTVECIPGDPLFITMTVPIGSAN